MSPQTLIMAALFIIAALCWYVACRVVFQAGHRVGYAEGHDAGFKHGQAFESARLQNQRT